MSKKPSHPSDDAERLRRHREARGIKKLKLQDLSKQTPDTSDALSYFAVVHGESDRGAVIMGSALLEYALTRAIRWGAGNPPDDLIKNWFEGPTAPFGTFAAKIQLGRVLLIYGDEMASRLALIKDIRNAFSHSIIPLDLGNPAVEEACDRLPRFKPIVRVKRNRRLIFLSACIGMARNLESYVLEIGAEPRTPRYP